MPGLLDSGMTETNPLLICVHNRVGGHRMRNGRWTALPLATLLDRAGLPEELAADPSRAAPIARSLDGFAIVLPLDVALARALVTVGLGGRPLPFGNGFPTAGRPWRWGPAATSTRSCRKSPAGSSPPTPAAIRAAATDNRDRQWSAAEIVRHADTFAEPAFDAALRAEVADLAGRRPPGDGVTPQRATRSSVGTAAPEHGHPGPPQDLEVSHETPVLDVVEV